MEVNDRVAAARLERCALIGNDDEIFCQVIEFGKKRRKEHMEYKF